MPTTVILGTGIIGVSTAYYLSRFAEEKAAQGSHTEKHEIHLVEATEELFASASGKAAGFVAKDWFQPAVTPLGEFSFDLHRKLAEEHDGRSKWGWSESTSYKTARSHRGTSRRSDLDWLMSGSSRSTLLDNPTGISQEEDDDDLPRWLHARRSSLQLISDRTTTGQVDPYRLCQFLLKETLARGAKLHQPARATQLLFTDPNDPSSKASAADYLTSGTNSSKPVTLDIPCDSIVIAAGCWTPRVYRALFPNAGRIPRVTALAGHSVQLKSKHWSPLQGCHAVFTSDRAGYSPEVFSRLGGDVWLGGYNSSYIPLPALASQAVPDPSSISVLVNTGKALCGEDVEIVREGLCFRPVAPTGRPVIARMHEADLGDGVKVNGGVFVATGHGPWGISLSLGTGHVVGEMILGREPSVDVKLLSVWEAQAV
ncbi:nucleotide-binding domain-containing protein [Irpex lacteus]|nr:nucleotide-binding domain-containing protein [Irpex lacteus]